jgi:hypothetical protein
MNIPNAGDFFDKRWMANSTIHDIMLEFAKLHVKAALEAASNKATLDGVGLESSGYERVNKDSILNAYPETLIT